jgi:sigma54-dependent transcription regulator
VIIWINGTFGVGKTTTAGQVVAMSERLRLFDPESADLVVDTAAVAADQAAATVFANVRGAMTPA